MAKIFFSMAGEGRGHATRAKTIIELLRPEHDITVFAPQAAYDLLEEAYSGSEVRLFRIPGLTFHYHRERLSIPRTLLGAREYLKSLPALMKRLIQKIRQDAPDLIVADFEPSLTRAALKTGTPFVSLDHQHFLVVSDLSCLPTHLRWKAEAMSWVVRAYCHGQAETIVSSFYFPPLKPRFQSNVVQTGVLLREQIVTAIPEQGRHLTVYLRRFAPPKLLEALGALRREVQIYGLGSRPSDGQLHFLPVCEQGFLADLVTCDALITNAGNQLVGEALHLGKPVFAIPEARNFEQQINACFLRSSGGGDFALVEQVDQAAVHGFLKQLDDYRNCNDRWRMNGNAAALAAITRHLPAPAITSINHTSSTGSTRQIDRKVPA